MGKRRTRVTVSKVGSIRSSVRKFCFAFEPTAQIVCLAAARPCAGVSRVIEPVIRIDAGEIRATAREFAYDTQTDPAPVVIAAGGESSGIEPSRRDVAASTSATALPRTDAAGVPCALSKTAATTMPAE